MMTGVGSNGRGRFMRLRSIARFSLAALALATGGAAVADTPAADFSADVQKGIVPFAVTFTDTSTGTVTNRFWSFGDGSTSNVTATTIAHTYTTVGTNTVQLIASGPDGADTNTKPAYIFSGTCAPVMSSTPSSIDFGAVVAGQCSNRTIKIVNTGCLPLNGYVSADSPYSTPEGDSFFVPPGATGFVTLGFCPLGVDNYGGSATVSSDGGTSTVSLSGIATPPASLVITPASFDFGYVATGQNAQTIFVVTNAGESSLSGTATVTGVFAVLGNASFSLAPHAASNIAVSFAPPSIGIFSNDVAFSSSAGDQSRPVTGIGDLPLQPLFSATVRTGQIPFTVSFTDSSAGNVTNRLWNFGDGNTLETAETTVEHMYANAGSMTVALVVQGAVGAATNSKTGYVLATNCAPQLLLTPSSLAFGSVAVGLNSQLNFKVVNTGCGTMSGNATVGAPFQILSGSPFTVAPGATNIVSVRFAPAGSGTFPDNIAVSSDGGDSTLAVSGTAVAPATIGLTPASYDFGFVATGQTAQTILVVSNQGDSMLSGTGFATYGFAVIGSGAFSLPPHGASNITVAFTPEVEGVYTYNMVFASNGGGSTNQLSGTGMSPPNALFDANIRTGRAPLVVTFDDQSTGTITNRYWAFGDGATSNGAGTSVAHTYTSNGNFTVQLIVANQVAASTNTKTGFVVTLDCPPLLSINPAPAYFGTNVVLQTNNLLLQIVNAGCMTLTGSAIAGGPFVISSGSPFSIAPLATNLLAVSFRPTSAGVLTNSLVIQSNGGSSTNELSGTALPLLATTPAGHDFGASAPGQPVDRILVVTNRGEATLAGTATVSGAFAIVGNATFNLGSRGASNISVRFTPPATGSFSNDVIFTSNSGGSTNPVVGIGADPLNASFTVDVRTGQIPFVVTFTDYSSGTITNRHWSFGDGNMTNTMDAIVQHTYAVAGILTVQLTVQGPASASTNTAVDLIAATNCGAMLASSPASLNFGGVGIGATGSMNVAIWNAGCITLTGTAAIGGPFTIKSGSPFSIASGQTGLVTVGFAPSAVGAFTSAITFVSNGGSPADIAVTGSGLMPPVLVANPEAHDFGEIATGQTAQLSFTVANSGEAVLSGTATVEGAFSIIGGASFTLSANGETNIVVRFAPQSAGSFSNDVVFSSNGGSSTRPVTGIGAAPLAADFAANIRTGVTPFAVTFTDQTTGTVTNRFWDFGDGSTSNETGPVVVHTYIMGGIHQVDLVVQGPTGVATNSKPGFISASNCPPLLAAGPASLDFGTIGTGQTNDLILLVTNAGCQTLNGSASAGGPFAIASGSPFTVTPGGTNAVIVSFRPASAGGFTNTVVIASDGGGATSIIVGAAVATAQIAVSPTSHNFGIVITGQTVQTTLTVTNIGDLPLVGTSYVDSVFTLVGDGSFNLPGHGSASVTISFSPATNGSFDGAVRFRSDGGNVDIPIFGTSIATPIADFISDVRTGQVPLTVTFTDQSAGTVTNRVWHFGDGATSNLVDAVVVHTYASIGTNNVQLIAQGPLGTSTNTKPSFVVVTNCIAMLPVTPATLDFGTIAVGQSNDLGISVANVGCLSMTGEVAVGGPFVVVSGAPFNIAPGASNEIMISFRPLSAGGFTNEVVIVSEAGVATSMVSGVAISAASIGIAPPAVDFGPVATGQTAQTSFTVTNLGGSVLSGTTTVGGAFAIVGDGSFALASHESVEIAVSFTPSVGGVFSNYVVFSSDGGTATGVVTGIGMTAPLADFTANIRTGVVPFSVTFTDTSEGVVTNRFWNFGDGATSNTTGAVVSHTFTSGGTNTVELVVEGPLGSDTNTKPSYIVGLLCPPLLTTAPGSIVFGSVMAGQSSNLNLLVGNSGCQTMTGTASVGGPFQVVAGIPFTLPAGSTSEITIAFSPSAAGGYTNLLVVSGNGGSTTTMVSGAAIAAAVMHVTPPGHDFGMLLTGQTAQTTFSVSNAGASTLSGTTTVGSAFSVVGDGSFNLAPNASANIVIRFAPLTDGEFEDQVYFTGNAGYLTRPVSGWAATAPQADFVADSRTGMVPHTVMFTDTSTGTVTNRFWQFGDGATSNGTGTSVTHTYATDGINDVRLIISGPLGTSTNTKPAFIVITNCPPMLSASPASFDFGTIIVGQSSNMDLQVANIGCVTMTGAVSATGPFSIQSGSPFSIAPGETDVVVIAFHPLASGGYTNQIVISGNGGSSSLAASGTAEAAGLLEVTPLIFDFGPLVTGTTADTIFTLTNNGVTLIAGTATVGGAFAVLGNGSFTLGGNAGTNITIRFAPLADGVFSNDVVFSSDGGISTNIVTGIGISAPVAAFSANSRTGVAPFAVTFTDTSSGTVTNRLWDFGDGGTSNATTVASTHTYATTGAFTVRLLVEGPLGTDTNTQPDYILVTTCAPQPVLLMTSHDFGTVLARSTNDQAFFIANAGCQELSGTAAVAGPFAIASGSPFNIPANSTGSVTVSFRPIVSGGYTNDIVFTTDGGIVTGIVTGVATPVGVPIVTPASHAFGSVFTGQTAQFTFAVTNAGEWPFNGTASVSPPFAIVGDSSLNLLAQTATNIVVSFSPVSTGTFSNSVSFATDAGTLLRPVTGIGIAAPLAGFTANVRTGLAPFAVTFTDTSVGSITNRYWVFGDGETSNALGTIVTHTYAIAGSYEVQLTVSGPYGVDTNTKPGYIVATMCPPQIILPSPAQDFGTIETMQTSNLAFLVANTGCTVLAGSASVAPPFSVVAGSPFNIGPGETNSLTISFHPVAAGGFTNQLILTSDGGNATGILTGVATPVAILGISPLTYDFGTIAVGGNAQTFVTITNSGDATLAGSVAAGSAFGVEGSGAFNVPSHTATNMAVFFAPVAHGGYTGDVVFASNGGTMTTRVTGVGTADPILPVVPDQNIPELTLITITNTQTAPISPSQLAYSLLDAPTGMTIDASGIITWTPTESQGPGAHTVTTLVVRTGIPQASFTNSFIVNVAEVNTAPQFTGIADQPAYPSSLITLTNLAIDPDIPSNNLTLTLVAAPPGATFDATNGVFAWTPDASSLGTTNLVTLDVADDGTPPLNSTTSFNIIVVAPGLKLSGMSNGAIITWPAGAMPFELQATTGIADTAEWIPVAIPRTTNGSRLIVTNPVTGAQEFFRLQLP